MVIVADEAVAAGVADDEALLDMGFEGWPIQRARLDSSSMRRLSVAGMAWTLLDQELGLGGELPPLEFELP